MGRPTSTVRLANCGATHKHGEAEEGDLTGMGKDGQLGRGFSESGCIRQGQRMGEGELRLEFGSASVEGIGGSAVGKGRDRGNNRSSGMNFRIGV